MAIYRRGAEGWHTDGAYDQEPFKATQLYALAVPSHRRRHALRQHVRGVRRAAAAAEASAWRDAQGAFTYGGRRKATALLNAEDRDWTPVFHPIIRTHPETGRKGLYFDPGKILRIEGLEAAESDALIDELTELHDPARRRVPPPLAQGRHRHLGQPLLVSQGGGRLPARGRPHPLARLDQGARGLTRSVRQRRE